MANHEAKVHPRTVESVEARGASNDTPFLHHSNHPNVVLVAPPMSGDNFGTWIQAMTVALYAENKIRFVVQAMLVFTKCTLLQVISSHSSFIVLIQQLK